MISRAAPLGGQQLADNDTPNENHDQFAPPPPPSNTDYRHARWPRFTDGPQASPASRARQYLQTPYSRRNPPEVLVVGVCSSGKSTLVRRLREAGYDARACSQEHSYVPDLWERSRPGTLVYLDAALDTIRRRGRNTFPGEILERQHQRLDHARRHCHLYIPTDSLDAGEVAARVTGYLQQKADNNIKPQSQDAQP